MAETAESPAYNGADLNVQWRVLDQLVPYSRNARTHSDEQVAQIASSIKEFGWTNPVLVDGDNGIIAGHARIMAARKLGLNQVPCIELSHLSETQKRAYIIADNKLAENAGWDTSLLSLELGALEHDEFHLELIGFSADELSDLMFENNSNSLSNEQDVSGDESDQLESGFSVLVDVSSENEQKELIDLLMEQGYSCRALTQ